MVNRSMLTLEAQAYFDSLPKEEQLALSKSNMWLHSLDELREFCGRMSPRSGEVLYQTLPESSIPSNQILDELDSE